MAYEKHNWQTGEVITADKLNHIEDGISSREYVVLEEAAFNELSDAEKVEQFNHCMSVFNNGGVVDVESMGLVARVTSCSDNPKYMVATTILSSSASSGASNPVYTLGYTYVSCDDITVTINVGVYTLQ